jgi:tRNA nucleotidyltransferase (CCA-adding enzyme)
MYEMKPSSLLRFFMQTDALRRPERFRKMTLACIADARGRSNFEDTPYPQAAYATRLMDKLIALDLKPVLILGKKAQVLGDAIYEFRLNYLKSIVETQPPEEQHIL